MPSSNRKKRALREDGIKSRTEVDNTSAATIAATSYKSDGTVSIVGKKAAIRSALKLRTLTKCGC